MGAAPTFSWQRRDAVAFGAIVAVALVVRWIYLVQLQASPYFHHEVMDAAIHDAWARLIAAGQPWAEGAYFRAPLYPWLLGLLYRVTSADPFWVRAAQMALGSLTCGGVYLLGARPFGRAVAWAGGLGCALYWVLIFFDGELLIAGTAALLDTWLLFALMRVAYRPRPANVALAGLLLGLAALARPNVLVFAPCAALWLGLFHPERHGSPAARLRQGLAPVAILTAATLAVVLPVTIRNAVVGGDRVLIASQAGVNFYIGNNPQADGMHVYLPGLTLTTDDIYRGSAEAAERELGRELEPSEVSRHYAAKAWSWIRSNPLDAARLTLDKARYFWSRREILNNKDLYLLTERYTPFVRALGVGFWLVGPLGLVGLAACAGRGRELFPLWGFVPCYMASVVPFFVNARFRVPLLPVLTLLAAHGALSLVRALRASPRGRGAALAGVLAAAVALVFVGPPPAWQSAGVEMEKLGAALLLQGRDDEAVPLLEEAARRLPESPQVRVTLGLAYERVERLDAAARSYDDALGIVPDYAPALKAGGLLAERLGETARAVERLARAAALAPGNVDVLLALGRARIEAGAVATGIDALTEAIEREPGRTQEALTVVDGLLASDRTAEAVRLLRAAVDARGDDAETRTRLAWLLASSPDAALRDGPLAEANAAEAVRLTGRRDPDALAALAAAQAEQGRFREALAVASEALKLARGRGDARAVAAITRQYRGYVDDRPWRLDR